MLAGQTGSSTADLPPDRQVGLPQMAAPPESGTAALNSRLLSHVGAPGGEADPSMGPGDLIEISVFEVEELSKLKLRIPMRGTITLPLIGQIPAAGRSAIQLEDDIRTRLQEKYIHDPQISVFVHEHKSQRISVIGAVRKGGVFTITNPLRLADALALAEGLADDADHTLYLIRRVPVGTVGQIQAGVAPQKRLEAPAEGPSEEVMVPIDLDMLVAGRDDLNVALEAGDVLHVPRAGSYYVGGSVERPGSFFLKGKTTAEQAIVAAGGPKNVADWDDVRVYRTKPGGDREILTFSLNEVEKGDGEKAPELQKNDVVVVGKSPGKAFLYGFLDFVRFGMGKGF
jgi:polysaccharide export outer membrane protein